MKNREETIERKNNEIFIIAMDIIEECLEDAIDKIEGAEPKLASENSGK